MNERGVVSNMYYILNETDQVVAADNDLLDLCGVSHINELSSKVFKNDIIFDFISDDTITVNIEGNEENYAFNKTSLSSMLGQLTLVNLYTEDQEIDSDTILFDNPDTTENMLMENIESDKDDALTSLNLDDTPSTFDSSVAEIDDDDMMDLIAEPAPDVVSEKNTLIQETIDDSKLFDLIGDDEHEQTIEAISTKSTEDSPLDLGLDDDLFIETPKVVDEPIITIDIAKVSEKIGISPDDYNSFLNEFIDASLELEKDLQSSEIEIRSEAIGTLSHLSDVLHLPVLGESIDAIEEASDSQLMGVIESFYNILSRITTAAPEKENKEELFEETEREEELELFEETEKEEKLELFGEIETEDEPFIQEEVEKRKTPSAESFGTISLEGIKPKHFDFQLEEAANDLSLPVELIEEFVHDFIDQAHVETKKMLEAYEDGDFDTIKKIGHLLKGASSNLRINALSDTLYKIQFCEDSNQLEPLIKDYWAHFLSFEHQINVISN